MPNTLKVLSIDGGGIRGLYSASFLEHLAAKHDTRIIDHFDMICGTSTGGLIALGLATGSNSSDIVRFYKEHGPKIFPKMNKWLSLWKQAFGGKYSDIDLRAGLEEFFGELTIGDSKRLLCVPSYSLIDGRPYIFRFDHKEGRLSRDNGRLCVEVGLATSAAPTFFPVATLIDGLVQLVDGGVCANNPANVGMAEALRYFVGPGKAYDHVSILSIETINAPVGGRMSKRQEKGFFQWRQELIDCFMVGQAKMSNHVLTQLSENGSIPVDYVRIESPKVSATQANLLTLDDASEEALSFLEHKGRDVADIEAVKPEVIAFFKTNYTYKV